MVRPTVRRALPRLLGLACIVLASSGCGGLLAAYDVAPSGLNRRDDALRRLLTSGRPDSAMTRLDPEADAAPGDELLRSLYAGILAHYAGRYDESGEALQRAADLTDERYTMRISRAALSLISSDRTLPYEPGPTERRLMHYYGALNFLRQGDLGGAAVEARRLAFLIERDDEREPDPWTMEVDGFLRHFTGVVFEAAGEWNDADVAYRNAAALLGRDAPPPAGPLPDSVGEVVVIVEQGYVAHRVEQALVVPLHPVEVARLTGGGGDERLATAVGVAARVLAEALRAGDRRLWTGTRPRTIRVDPPPDSLFADACAAMADASRATESRDSARAGEATRAKRPARTSDRVPKGRIGATDPRGSSRAGVDSAAARVAEAGAERDDDPCNDDAVPYTLRIAWPVHRLDRAPTPGVRVVGPELAATPLARADLSGAVVRDFGDERGLVLARTVARATTKLALTKGLEKSAGGKDETLGRALGVLANLGTALLEHADTRSWHLLPGSIGLVRLRLPPGDHPLTLEVDGEAAGPAGRVDLGHVTVVPGRFTFLSARIWR